jgi:hypothetical protein
VTPETLIGIPEMLRSPGAVTVFVVEDVDGARTVGIGGGSVVARGPTIGNTPGVGIAGAELTPRLAISHEPMGIPVLGTPPGVVGVVDVGVEGVEAMPLEPAPHIPDKPTVPVAEVVDIPEIGSIPGSVAVADGADIPADIPPVVVLPDIAVVPTVAAVAIVADPIVIPPPSYVSVDPINPDGEVTRVEHVVPLPGNAIVPVE